MTASECLRRRDAHEFKNYWALAGLESKVHYHSDFAMEAGAVLICDEADNFIIKNQSDSKEFWGSRSSFYSLPHQQRAHETLLKGRYFVILGFRRFYSIPQA